MEKYSNAIGDLISTSSLTAYEDEKLWSLAFLFTADDPNLSSHRSIMEFSVDSKDLITHIDPNLQVYFDTSKKATPWTVIMNGVTILKAINHKSTTCKDIEDVKSLMMKVYDHMLSIIISKHDTHNNMIWKRASLLMNKLLTSFISIYSNITSWYVDYCITQLSDSLGNYSRNVVLDIGTPFIFPLRILSAYIHDQMTGICQCMDMNDYCIRIQSILLKCDITMRKEVICRLITPFVTTLLSSDTIGTHTQFISNLMNITVAISKTQVVISSTQISFDYYNALLVICLLMSQQSDILSIICQNYEKSLQLWTLVQKGILHTDILVRKRALYILQTLVKHMSSLPDRQKWTDYLTILVQIEGCNSLHLVQQVIPMMERLFYDIALSTTTTTATATTANAAVTITTGESTNQVIVRNIDNQNNTTNIDDATDNINNNTVHKSSIADFDHIYNDTHTSSLISVTYQGTVLYLPQLNFVWVKSTIHCILRAQPPNIRRLGLSLLLTGRLTVYPNQDMIQWFCYDILTNLSDSVSYFSAYYLDNTVDLGCQIAIDEVLQLYDNKTDDGFVYVDGDVSSSSLSTHQLLIGGPNTLGEYSQAYVPLSKNTSIQYEQYPGTLLPSFLARVLAVCTLVDRQHQQQHSNLTAYMITTLLHIICTSDGLQSLSAVKWAMRAFSEYSVLSLLPRCIVTDSLNQIRCFLEGRLLSSNELVRTQILSGLIPLICKCCCHIYENPNHPSADQVVVSDECPKSVQGHRDLVIRQFMSILVHIVGWDLSLSLVNVMKNDIVDKVDKNNTMNVLVESLSEAYFHILPKLYLHSVSSSHDNICNDILQLYDSDDMYLLAIVTVLIGHSLLSERYYDANTNGHNSYLIELGQRLIEDLPSLYMSPYMAPDRKLSILKYTQGLIRMIQYTSSIKNSTTCIYQCPIPLLSILPGCIEDLTAYIVNSIKQSLSFETTYLSTSTTTMSLTHSSNTRDRLTSMTSLELYLDVLFGSLHIILYLLQLKHDSIDNVAYAKINEGELYEISFKVLLQISQLITLLIDGFGQYSGMNTATNTTTTTILSGLYLYIIHYSLSRLNSVITLYSSKIQDILLTYSLQEQFTQQLQILAFSLITCQPLCSVKLFKSYIHDHVHVTIEATTIDSTPPANTNNIKSPSRSYPAESLNVSYILDTCKEQYSRYSDMMLTNRWSSLCQLFTIFHHLHIDLLTSTTSIQHTDDISDSIIDCRSTAVHESTLYEETLDQLSVCSPQSVSSIITCCMYAVIALVHRHTKRETSYTSYTSYNNGDSNRIDHIVNENIMEKIQVPYDKCYEAAMQTSEITDMRAVQAFICFIFHDKLIGIIDPAILQHYFTVLMELGMKKRPQIITAVTLRLCYIWTSHPILLCSCIPLVQTLLLCKEPLVDDHNIGNTSSLLSDQSTGVSGVDSTLFLDVDGIEVSTARFMVLTVLEKTFVPLINCVSPSSTTPTTPTDHHLSVIKSSLYGLIRHLFQLNTQPEFKTPAMIGSDLFGQKLRCWQALCILSPIMSADLIQEVSDIYFSALSDGCVHTIRMFMEVCGASMCRLKPSIMMPKLIQQLKLYNHSQQKLASLFVILGHLCLECTEIHPNNLTETSNSEDEDEIWSIRHIAMKRRICLLIVSWIGCSQGLPRAIAQLVILTLVQQIQQYIHKHSEDSLPTDSILFNIYTYLDTNRDSIKILARQRDFFMEYSLLSRCSLQGLLDIQRNTDNSSTNIVGDIAPCHLVTILENFLKSEMLIESLLVAPESLQPSYLETLKKISISGETIKSPEESSILFDACRNTTMQIKRLPFDELKLTLDEYTLTRQQNASGRKKQDLIVCASLIDKVVNLAGLARTCEIFALQELILPTKSVIKSEVFQGIAVSSENWLTMNEVKECHLLDYLRRMKRLGYTIVGLEQTDESINLAYITPQKIPKKSVLLLGKEKEGIPVEYLAEVDICIEIPQFGVTRSLNVHVSAALLIWEITKLNDDFIPIPSSSVEITTTNTTTTTVTTTTV